MPKRAAEDPPGRAGSGVGAKAALDKEAVCTECHDPSAKQKLYFIYQTRHGVKADAAAPTCQSCHGESDTHNKDPGKPTDIVFNPKSKNLSAPEDRNGACLTCHASERRARTGRGASTSSEGVACTSCHNIHAPEQKVLNKATQAEVCFTCHKDQRAQTHRISAHPLATKGLATGVKMSCSDCHNPHGSTGPNLLVKNTVNETCYTCHAEKRGPVPLGARARRRQLHDLPHAARLGQHAAAQGADAVAVPGLPQRRPRQPGAKRRQPEGRRRDHDQRTADAGGARAAPAVWRAELPELPRAGAWLESSGRREVLALIFATM